MLLQAQLALRTRPDVERPLVIFPETTTIRECTPSNLPIDPGRESADNAFNLAGGPTPLNLCGGPRVIYRTDNP